TAKSPCQQSSQQRGRQEGTPSWSLLRSSGRRWRGGVRLAVDIAAGARVCVVRLRLIAPHRRERLRGGGVVHRICHMVGVDDLRRLTLTVLLVAAVTVLAVTVLAVTVLGVTVVGGLALRVRVARVLVVRLR